MDRRASDHYEARRHTEKNMRIFAIGAILLTVACGGGSQGGADGKSGQRAVLQNKGSDTLVNVAQAWAENYKEVEPNVAIAVTGGGSGTGISAMINGTVDIANASRKMKDKEIALAKKNGIDPVEHTVGFDALAVFLHHDNPIKELTIEQLQGIYAEGGTTEKWSDLGIEVPGCSSDEIVRVSRQNNSGTYAYFKKAVLGKGAEFKLGSRDMHGSKDVVDLVEKTPCAIGYSGLAYANDHIAMPCVKRGEGECVAPTVATAADGSYPIARPLLMYTAGAPEGPVKAYLDWILSKEGQCIIFDKGYAPVDSVDCG
jgi:phosphate transport system substrate-binding protein